MFWDWFWDLYGITFGFIQPCPSCYLWPSEDCGYLERDWYSGECDCVAPDMDELYECECCHHLICSKCRSNKENR
jgi:hypothetical protein